MSNVNEKWEERWKEVVQTDNDFDPSSLVRITMNKIGLMIDTLKLNPVPEWQSHTDDELNEIIPEMEKIYNLGERIMSHNYGEEADNIFNDSFNIKWLTGEGDQATYNKWDKLTKKAIKERECDMKTFFKLISDNCTKW